MNTRVDHPMPGTCPRKSILAALFFLAIEPAQAYLDPGSVSIAIQALVAAIAGGVLTAKYWFWRVMDFFRIGKKKKTADKDNRDTDE